MDIDLARHVVRAAFRSAGQLQALSAHPELAAEIESGIAAQGRSA
jgi:hypothetical protein